MTTEELKSWVRDNMDRKLREFGLPHWRVDIDWTRISDERTASGFASMMRVSPNPPYERAVIEIDVHNCCATYESLDEFESAIEHELMHIVHSPFELARKVAGDMLDDALWNVFVTVYDQAAEMTVRNMERMRFGLREACKPAEE